LEAIMAVGEWDQRQLCSDGGCVGVIGPTGTCKVCGRAAQNWGDERKRGLIEPADEEAAASGQEEDDDDEVGGEVGQDVDDDLDDDEVEDDGDDDLDDDDEDDDGDDDDDDEDDADALAADGVEADAVVAAPDWGARRLCPDGSCIGVIGADGRCKVCGRQAPGNFQTTASGTADSGFAIETTATAVSTTEDAVQTVASTVTTDAPPAPDDAPPDGAEAPASDPDSKDPNR
jgi:hypothetical protein